MATEITNEPKSKTWTFLSYLLMLSTIGVTGLVLILLLRWFKRRKKYGSLIPQEKVAISAPPGTEIDVQINGSPSAAPSILDPL